MKEAPLITYQPHNPEKAPEWRVEEKFSLAKDEERGSEDGCLISAQCIAVLDGVSSGKSKERIGNLTLGQFAVKAGIEALEKVNFNNPNEIVPFVTKEVATALNGETIAGRPSFVFAAFFPKHNCIIRVGDCLYLIDSKGYNPGLAVDRAKAVVRKRALQRLLTSEMSPSEEEIIKSEYAREPPPFRERATALTKNWQQAHFPNNPDPVFGYGVIDGSDVPPSKVEYIAVPPDAQEIILATDGYPPEALASTLKETEANLQKLLQEDPLGLRLWSTTRSAKPGAPSFDDRLYLRLSKK